ncbi:hypothetical protein PISMIDRAFT_673099 [Pisolithus microcarpus 441]|uniref:Uncharacterized protein n=1 Tax=Pisolithus microcarpus 441 TaxID=765257 RepID=A0A0C9ZHX1_9AGAM|nr:hypothetical protein PISMIDRAFT_673099 [Pisolithus microcarpus 441]
MLSLLVLKSSVGDIPTHIKLTAQCNPMSQRSTFNSADLHTQERSVAGFLSPVLFAKP